MAMTILDATTRAAVAAATDQEAALTALAAPFVTAGAVTVVSKSSGGTVKGTGTYGLFSIISTTPRKLRLGALSGYTPGSNVTPTVHEFWAGIPGSGGVLIHTDDSPTFPGGWGANPRVRLNDSSAAGGATYYEVTAPSSLPLTGDPAWLAGAPVGEWIAIPGTAGLPVGLNNNAYGDMTLRPSDSTLLVVAAGGHSDGSSNGAASLKLSDDAPAWVARRDSSTPTPDVNYYADGRPTARHTYHHTHYIASRDAVMLAGCNVGYGPNTPTHPGVDLFDLTTNDYTSRVPSPTYPNVPAGYGTVQDGDGHIWTQTGHKLNVNTATWSQPGTGSLLRFPAAYDSIRNKIFAMQWRDGQDSGDFQLYARELDPATGNSVDITFNSSAALTALIAATPMYAGMAFCPLNGKFYFIHGGETQKLYIATPNAGNWDMTVQTIAGATVPATQVGTILKRLLWVPALQGFVLQTNFNSNLNFMRMA
jgi:hypothetical protein